jgi:hypothetical protein
MTTQQSLYINTSNAELTIPIIAPVLFDELLQVVPSVMDKFEYRPCIVEDVDGSIIDRVYVVEAISFALYWGLGPKWPHVSISKIAHIRNSPTRLPVALANKLYELGETNMGGVVFTIVIIDGRKAHGVSGNAVDFLNYPPGIEPKDVVDVLHGKSEGFERFASANYQWCLYALPPAEAAEKLKPLETALRNWKVKWRYGL